MVNTGMATSTGDADRQPSKALRVRLLYSLFGRLLICLLLSLATTFVVVKFFTVLQQPSNEYTSSCEMASSKMILVYGGIVYNSYYNITPV